MFLQTIVNLAEKSGKESNLTNAYREYIDELSSKDVRCVENIGSKRSLSQVCNKIL